MNKLNLESKNITSDNIEKIKELFPNVVTESKDGFAIDFDLLKQELSNDIVDGIKERYQLTWPGKKEAILNANKPTTKTLRPLKVKSVNFENTENIYIEGDNLEVLKILQESYLNKIKCIYIDPPYNTGKDFIYKDNFNKDKEQELIESGQIDDLGNRFVTNSETSGKYHSDWLSMMYPRLKLARNLLTEDGVIFISIDEHEYTNLLKLCDLIFGSENYIENFIWIKNSTKNLSKTTSTNHEYIICYAKNITVVEELVLFRKSKEGLDEVYQLLDKAKELNLTAAETEIKLKTFYKNNPNLKGISSYDKVELIKSEDAACFKAYTVSDLSAPKATGKAATYDVIHPITKKPCKVPSRGWGFTQTTMLEHLKNNAIHFYEDETKVPRFKRYLDTVETEVVKSIIQNNEDGKRELMRLFDGEAFFENSKPISLITNLINLHKDSIVLDFFSGSATTAHAVMQLNAEDGGNRKYIMVQLPEECVEKSEAFKSGYKTICEIGQERIRRAGKKIQEEKSNNNSLDIGFRVYKLDSSNMNDVYYTPNETSQSMFEASIDNIKLDRTSEDLLTQVILNLGLTLDLPIEERSILNNKVYYVAENSLVACFEDNITLELIEELCKCKPLKLVFKEFSFKDDNAKINIETKIKKLSPTTSVNII